MRKTREKIVHDLYMDMIVGGLDKQVEEKKITETEASELYKLTASIRLGAIRPFDKLRTFVYKPFDTKEAIKERRLNEERDEKGNIVPAPLPQEVPARSFLSKMLGMKPKTA